MKICPKCRKTYTDDNLNFCLDDGSTQTSLSAADNSVPATVMVNQSRPAGQPPPPFGSQGGAQANWNAPNQLSAPPPKHSKTWLWILGILGGVVLLCGGGLVGLIFVSSRMDTKNGNRLANANFGVYNANSMNKNKSVANSNTDSDSQKVDLSRWVKGDIDLGVTRFENDELLMSSKKRNYYYVILAPPSYKTGNAITKVTVRNINGEDTNLGFGLVINSNPVPLTQDYAFLIDSENKKYRVVRHTPGDEIVVVGWTRTTSIKDGAQENVLEVRDEGKTMNFYINGEFIRTVGNTDGYIGGVPGLYAADAVPLAFSDLEVNQ